MKNEAPAGSIGIAATALLLALAAPACASRAVAASSVQGNAAASSAATGSFGSTQRLAQAARESGSYDYNVPLAFPPYGYAPSFWGYGGRRYYDKFGNYRKYGQPGAEPVDEGPVYRNTVPSRGR